MPVKKIPAGTTEIIEKSRNVHFIKHALKSTKEKDAFWVLLSFDRHHDNPKSDNVMEKRHLEQAREKNAIIIDGGDLFCAMQGKYDPRSDKRDLKPEHQTGDYLDKLVSTAADFYGPYADLFAIIAPGNHETAISKRHETNLTERLVTMLNDRNNLKKSEKIHVGGFSGWVKFQIMLYGQSMAINLWYHHGYGGDAPVTKGVIQTNRQSVYLPDAHIVATGHTHNEWQFPIPRLRLSANGKVYHDEQLHLKVPSYKEEYVDGYGGWHIERGGPPKPTGAVWLRIGAFKSSKVIDGKKIDICNPVIDCFRAK
jgi:hypothetical protein